MNLSTLYARPSLFQITGLRFIVAAMVLAQVPLSCWLLATILISLSFTLGPTSRYYCGCPFVALLLYQHSGWFATFAGIDESPPHYDNAIYALPRHCIAIIVVFWQSSGTDILILQGVREPSHQFVV
jgi:hypothetical protein